MIKKAMMLLLILILALAICGCTVSHGMFMGLSQHADDTALQASYLKFDGSLAQRVSLEDGDEVRFYFEGDDGLEAVVKRNQEEVCVIVDGDTFTAPKDGRYDFTIEGSAEDGTFSLTWDIE